MTNIISQTAPPDYRIPAYIMHPVVADHTSSQQVDWGLEMFQLRDIQQGVGGEGVHVGVCDTGWPEGGHPDLPEPEHVLNFTNESDGYDTRQGHGTHVAGIIAGQDNNIGMVGVAPKCKISSLKCLGRNGSGNSSWIAASIRGAVDIGCDIINLSLGGPYWKETEEAINYANENNVFVICAAGNSGERGMDYPALLPGAFAVASLRADGKISNFSSRGMEVDIAAPGEQILSTWLDNAYNVISGTSMACPFVAGVIALLKSARTDYTVPLRNSLELRGQLSKFSTDIGDPGHDRDSGHGIFRIEDLISSFRGNVPPNSHI